VASAVVSIVVSLRANSRFDFDSLAEGKPALLEREGARASKKVAEDSDKPAAATDDDVLVEPAGQQ